MLFGPERVGFQSGSSAKLPKIAMLFFREKCPRKGAAREVVLDMAAVGDGVEKDCVKNALVRAPRGRPCQVARAMVSICGVRR